MDVHRLRSTLSLIKLQLEAGGYPSEVLLRELDEAILLLDGAFGDRARLAEGDAYPDQRVRVLVADDEPQLADVLARRLRREGLDARAVYDLPSVQERADAEVLLIDLSLLERASPEERDWIASARPVVVTGASFREGERLLIGIEPFAVVQKPFSSEELASLVRRRAAEGRA